MFSFKDKGRYKTKFLIAAHQQCLPYDTNVKRFQTLWDASFIMYGCQYVILEVVGQPSPAHPIWWYLKRNNEKHSRPRVYYLNYFALHIISTKTPSTFELFKTPYRIDLFWVSILHANMSLEMPRMQDLSLWPQSFWGPRRPPDPLSSFSLATLESASYIIKPYLRPC